jgi:hypothetical protein
MWVKLTEDCQLIILQSVTDVKREILLKQLNCVQVQQRRLITHNHLVKRLQTCKNSKKTTSNRKNNKHLSTI